MMLQLYWSHIYRAAIFSLPTRSRKFLDDTYRGLSEHMVAQVHMVMSILPVSDKKLSNIRVATESDNQCQLLKSNFIRLARN